MSNLPAEVETVLFICSDTPAAIADEIAQLTALDSYPLKPQPDQYIRDIHFDAGNAVTWGKGVALRARRKNGKFLITLKGPPTLNTSGSVSRFELEAPWEPSAIADVTAQLHRLGMTIPPLPETITDDDAPAVLRANGFRVIQSRTTRRRVRDITAPDGGDALAEMDIDAIRYDLTEGPVTCYEIEIEAKSSAAPAIIDACAARLLDRFAPSLRPWPYGKLMTGSAIAQMFSMGKLDKLLAGDGQVGIAACRAIEKFLRIERLVI